MISYLKGKIINKGNGFVIIEVNSIGYKVFVNTSLYADFKVGETRDAYTHQHVREDALDLFGFKSMDELELFELLISISGVGPKTALGVLAIGSVNEIRESIAHGDSELLTKVSGIGKKTAERVVLELKDKMSYVETKTGTHGERNFSSDEIDALMALGYSLNDAREALRMVDSSIKNPGQRIKEALRMMGKK